MDLTMVRKLANGEEPYGTGPFDSNHVELFQGDARKLITQIDRLHKIEQAAQDIDRAIGQWTGVALSPEVSKTYIALTDALDGIGSR